MGRTKRTLLAELRRHTKLGLTVRVTLRSPPEERVYGFPLSVSEEMLLLREIDDYRVNGFHAIPLGNVQGLRSGPYERFSERILKAEGLAARARKGKLAPVESMPVFLRWLLARRRNVIVQASNLSGRPREERFYLGRLARVGAAIAELREVDALGRWSRSLTALPFNEITEVEFDDHYSRVFSKYAPLTIRRQTDRR